MDPQADHYAAITTPRGSVVTLLGLTEQQRDEVVANLAPDLGRDLAQQGKGETEPCTNCGGKGWYMEKQTQKTGAGGTVVVEVRVNCRPCKGNGTVPKRK